MAGGEPTGALLSVIVYNESERDWLTPNLVSFPDDLPDMLHPLLKIGPRINVLPVVHGSGDFAWEVRRVLMNGQYDCLAVPLPPSFQNSVEAAVLDLPKPSVVYQQSLGGENRWPDPDSTAYTTDGSEYGEQEFERSDEDRTSYERQFESSDADDDLDDFDGEEGDDSLEASEAEDQEESWDEAERLSYVPIDPCQPVIAAIRTAMGEHIPRKFIDLETDEFEPYSFASPDPYSLKEVRIERFAAAMLPHVPRPLSEQRIARIQRMAYELRQLSIDHENILLVCSVLDWPWIREAYFQPNPNPPHHPDVSSTHLAPVDPKTYFFMLGELPFITSLYEEARQNLDDDSRLSIDGVKQLLITARDRYNRKMGKSARKITPLLLRQCLQYIRNMTLMDRRLSPDLFTIIRAVQQVAGDTYAYFVLKTARKYWVGSYKPSRGVQPDPDNDSQGIDFVEFSQVKVGIDKVELADGTVADAVSRLPGPPIHWSHLELKPKQDQKKDRDKWMQNWNPYMQCSWPPEDDRIERFRSAVFDRAKQIIGADAARSEKFTTSVQDGIDIRETLRHWYDGDLYVKIHPPVRGGLDCVIMLFDTPADPREYKWRATWFAEHAEESTLAFFATPFEDQPVGPGICMATYGGALFLFPPRSIHDIWRDRRFDFSTTLEERLIAAGCKHAQCRQVALLSPVAPGHNWRKIAKMFGKTLVHVPLGQFSDSTIQQLRIMHVLNGKKVRSYAADFIRRS